MEKKRKNSLSGMIDLNTQKMLWNYDFVPSDNHLLSQDTWQHKSGKVLIAFQAPKYYVVVWGNAENVYNFDKCERKKYIGFKDYFPNILQKLQKILINHTSDTALQKLELQLLDDEDFKVGDIVFIAKGTHFLYKELALIDEINDEYYKLYHILKRNTGGYIYRPLNVDFIPKSKKISLSHVSKKLSDEIKQSLEKELSGLENKVRYIFDNVPSDQKAEMTKALELIKNSGLNGLFGTSKTENDNAAQKLLDSIKDTELKDVIKPYFSSLPKLKSYPPFIVFSNNAIYVGVDQMCYKIKYNVPKELVGKSSHTNRDSKSIDNVFVEANRNKLGIKYPPKTFTSSNIDYMFKKYDVLKFEDYSYLFSIGHNETENVYFNPEYLKKCLKFADNIYLSSLKHVDLLYSKSENIEYVLCETYVGNHISDITLVDFINDEVESEYGVKSRIEYLFEISTFEVLKYDLSEGLKKQSCRIADLKFLQKQVDEYKQLNKAYKLLTGKECKEIPEANLNPYVEGELNLCEFIAEDDELRPALWNIGYQSGYAIATDSRIFVAVKDQYRKSREGRSYNILGYDITDKYKYPKVESVLQKLQSPLKRITIDFDRLENAIKIANKLPKNLDGKYTRNVMLDCGVLFRVDLLEKVLYFLDFCKKPQFYLKEEENLSNEKIVNLLVIKDENETHNLILYPLLKSDIFVSCVDLKYHLTRLYYGKEGDRITSIVKGNCVTFEDTELHKLELKLFDND